MAWSFVGAVGTNFSVSQDAGAPGEPAGCADGDIFLNFLVTDTVHSSSGTPPTGWTKIGEQSSGTDSTMSVFWKRRSGVESELWSSIFSGNETGRAVTIVIRGAVAAGDPQDVAAVFGTDSGTAWDTGSITPVTDGCLLVAAFGCDPGSDPYTFTWDAGIDERIDSDTSPTGQNGVAAYIAIGTDEQVTAAPITLGGDNSDIDAPATVIIALKPAAGGAFTIDAAPGAYTLTGAVAGVPATRLIAANPGSYTLTGVAASVPAGRAIKAAPGTYAVTGSLAGVIAARNLNAGPGTYAITGAAASIVAGRIVAALPGAYVLTGFAAELALQGQFSLDANPGAYALTGSPTGLVADRLLVTSAGTYAITGANAALLTTRLLSALPGSYLITGSDATLVYGVPEVILWPDAVAPHFGENTVGRIHSPERLAPK